MFEKVFVQLFEDSIKQVHHHIIRIYLRSTQTTNDLQNLSYLQISGKIFEHTLQISAKMLYIYKIKDEKSIDLI